MTDVVPEVYAEVLPAVGDVFDGRGGYYLIGGRFRLRGTDHRQVRRAVPGALLVFLAPPSWEELVRRLTSRDTEPPEVIRRRLEAAQVELAAGSEFDITLVNTSVQDVCHQLVALTEAPSGQ